MHTMRILGMTLLLTAGAAAWAQDTQPASQPAQRALAAVEWQSPWSLAVDKGTLYVVDTGAHKIVKITAAGDASVLDGPGVSDIQTAIAISLSKRKGTAGELAVADLDNNKVYRISPQGQAAEVATGGLTSAPAGAVIDSRGNLFIADNKNASIIKITPDGESSVFAGKADEQGGADGKAADARFSMPRAIAIDDHDNLYVADEGNSNVRKITPDGTVTTLAGGSGAPATAPAPEPAPAADAAAPRFAAPRGIAVDKDGNVFLADTDNHAIRKISPSGQVTTIAGKVGEAGNADGPAADSRLNSPRGVAVDDQGNVYIADSENALLREVSPDGTVRTISTAK
ncbi:MAG TPA: hypothetical protein VH253_15720 [Phycisphaerae bacterium]|nr:hypothetical protein [Phycisphaerae bacterium]